MNKSFTGLNIKKDVVGPWHTNRFRIYFRVPPVRQISKYDLVRHLTINFPIIFNGEESLRGVRPVSNSRGGFPQRNIATVDKVNDRHFNGFPTFKFTMDLRGAYNKINLPDSHDDWVGQVWSDPNLGFAVQTLKNHQDDLVLLFDRPVLNPYLRALLLLYSLYTNWNSEHFLAGYRSWVIGNMIKQKSNKSRYVISTTEKRHRFRATSPIFFLETAAIERFSGYIFKILSSNSGWLVNNMEKSIQNVWITLLRNFVTSLGFEPIENIGSNTI